MWKHTKSCIENIESLLVCKLCYMTVRDPQGLGSCEHFFCSECIVQHIGKCCPECSIPSYAMDAHPNRRIAGLVQQITELKQFLNELAESNIVKCNAKKDNCEKDLPAKDEFPQPIRQVDEIVLLSSPSNPDYKTSHSNSSQCLSTAISNVASDLRNLLDTSIVYDDIVTSKSDQETSEMINQTGSPKVLSKTSHGGQDLSVMEKTVNRRNAKGETPLHLAAIKRDVRKVINLLKLGANPNVKDNAGWTPLHEACNTGCVEIVTLLLDAGAKINTPGFKNLTPLHDAVECGRFEVVKLLMTRGADPTRRNIHGQTPIDLTRDENMKSLLTSMENCCVIINEGCEDIGDFTDRKPLVFLYTGLNGKQKEMLIDCAKILNAKVVNEFNSEVTHLITSNSKQGTCPRTLKYLFCIITGKWIVRFKWIENCFKNKAVIAEDEYEVNGTNTQPLCYGPRKARINLQKQNPGLLSGCHIYFHGRFSSPSPAKEDLVKLIQLGEGIVLNREPRPDMIGEHELTVPFHAAIKNGAFAKCSYFIIYQDDIKTSMKYNSKFLKSLPVAWLLECISKFEILEDAENMCEVALT